MRILRLTQGLPLTIQRLMFLSFGLAKRQLCHSQYVIYSASYVQKKYGPLHHEPFLAVRSPCNSNDKFSKYRFATDICRNV